MSLGKQVRLNRIFRNGRLCSVAVDHFFGYYRGLPAGLRDLPAIIDLLMTAEPDAITMFRGAALRCWEPYAGRVPLIIQSSAARWDDTLNEPISDPEDAVRLGADAIAVAALVLGRSEGAFVRRVVECARAAARLELPVILHVYPIVPGGEGGAWQVSFRPEHIEYAVRVGIETGVDVVKAPYTGDAETYGEIARACPVPLVAAGGPQTATLAEALRLAEGIRKSGALGMTIGRNIWSTPHPAKTLRAYQAVIHEGLGADAAMRNAGFEE